MLKFDDLWERLIVADESTAIEVKRGSDVGKSLLESVSAFANEPDNGGGYFVLGVVRDEVGKLGQETGSGLRFVRSSLAVSGWTNI